ncbi:MAG: mechanosensitive ion channel [Parasporobacterium sp.]|nr:mechanosensitive ion channel [Parasporobacterium sp.]
MSSSAFSVINTVDIERIKESLKGVSVEQILIALTVLVLGIIVVSVLSMILRKALERSDKIDKSLHVFLVTGFRIVFYLCVILAAIGTMGINISIFIVIFGLIGLAVSFAIQGILSNVAGGLLVIFTRPFKVGDLIEVDGAFGIVQRIGFNYTTIKSLDAKEYHVPNKNIANCKIMNTTLDGLVRLSLDVDVSYDTPEDSVFEALNEAADFPTVMKEPSFSVIITAYKDSAITYQLRVYVKPEDYVATKAAIYRSFRRIFAKYDVTFTYPHMITHSAD